MDRIIANANIFHKTPHQRFGYSIANVCKRFYNSKEKVFQIKTPILMPLLQQVLNRLKIMEDTVARG